MKTWKKILTLALIMLSSVLSFFACGKDGKYDNMTISIVSVEGLDENNTLFFSNTDSSLNKFTIKVKVDGVGGDVSTSVDFRVNNGGVATLLSSSQSGNVTTANFEAKSDGNTIIQIVTAEGNKSYDFNLSVKVLPSYIRFKNKNIAVIKEEDTAINIDNIDFYPENVTQKGIKFVAVSATGEEAESELLNMARNQIALSEQNHTLPVFNFANYTGNETSFKLRMYLKDSYNPSNETEFEDEAVVQILTKATLDKFKFVDITSYGQEIPQELQRLEYVNGKYQLKLSVNVNSKHEIVKKFRDADITLSPVGEIEADKYSVSIKNMTNSGGELSDTNIITAHLSETTAGSYATFDIIGTGVTGEYDLIILVDYKGYEDAFAPLEIPLRIKTVMYPNEIRLYETNSDREEAYTKAYEYELMQKVWEDTLQLGDDDIVVYTSTDGDPTPVYLSVWSETSPLSSQEVKLSIDDEHKEHITIVSSPISSKPIDSCYSGGVFYLKKDSTPLEGTVTLTLTSSVFSSVSKDIIIKYVNEPTSISVKSNSVSVDLNADTLTNNPSDVNQYCDLFNKDGVEGYVSFTGLEKFSDGDFVGQYDFSRVTVEIKDETYARADYDADKNNFVLKVNCKVGQTQIRITAPNGVTTGWLPLIINLPLTEANQFSVQIKYFEDSQKFTGFNSMADASVEESLANAIPLKLTVGLDYDFYYRVKTQNNEYLSFVDLAGIISNYQIVSSNTNAVKVEEGKFKIIARAEENVIVTFKFNPLKAINDVTEIYASFEIETFVPVSSLSTQNLSITINDIDEINPYAYINGGLTDELYKDVYGYKNIGVEINPTTASDGWNITAKIAGSSGYYFENKSKGHWQPAKENTSIYVYLETLDKLNYRISANWDKKYTEEKSVSFKVVFALTQEYIDNRGNVVGGSN